MTQSTGFRTRLALIAAGAFALRLAYILTVGKRNPTGGDPLYYHVQANLLADGHGFSEPFTWQESGRLIPTAVHPPLFTIVLAGSSVLGLTGFFAHKLVAALVGTATVVVIALVTREASGGRERAALIAAVVAAVYPNLWVIDGILMPEGLFALTIALVILASYWLWRAATTGRAIALGVAIGLAALTRGEAILLLAILALPLLAWRRDPDRVSRVRLAGAVVLAAAVVIAPWSIRNALRFERPVLLSTNGEEVLVYANCESVYYGRSIGFWDYFCQQGDPPGDETERAAHWRRQGVDYALDHKGRAAVVVAARIGRVWDVYQPVFNTSLSTIEGRDRTVSRWGLAMYALLVPTAIAGAVSLRRRRLLVWPLAAQAVLVTATAAYAYGVTRFRVPAEVAIVVLAAVAIDRAIARRSKEP